MISLTGFQKEVLRRLAQDGCTLSLFGTLWRNDAKHGQIDFGDWHPMLKAGLIQKSETDGWIRITEAGRAVVEEEMRRDH